IRISGRVTGIPAGQENVSVSIVDGGGGATVRPDGTFEIWRVDPGKRSIRAFCPCGGAAEVSPDVELDIGQSDIDNLELRIIPPVDIPGRVVFEDEEARRGPRPRSVSLEDSANHFRTSKQFEEASIKHKVVHRRIHQAIVGGPVYVRSMQYVEANIEGSQLDLRSGAAATLTLHVASAAGTITGIVRDDKGPVAGASVVVAHVAGEHSQYQVW